MPRGACPRKAAAPPPSVNLFASVLFQLSCSQPAAMSVSPRPAASPGDGAQLSEVPAAGRHPSIRVPDGANAVLRGPLAPGER